MSDLDRMKQLAGLQPANKSKMINEHVTSNWVKHQNNEIDTDNQFDEGILDSNKSGLTVDELVGLSGDELDQKYSSGQIDMDTYRDAINAQNRITGEEGYKHNEPGWEFDEEIELGDNTADEPAWYIVDFSDNSVSSGPYKSKEEAQHDAQFKQWYNEGQHEIEYGVDDDGVFVKDDEQSWDWQSALSSDEDNKDVDEGYSVSPPIDREKYTDLSYQGLEGPFKLKSGKTVYYDPKEGKYYDRDSDMFMSYDEYQSHTLEEAGGYDFTTTILNPKFDPDTEEYGEPEEIEVGVNYDISGEYWAGSRDEPEEYPELSINDIVNLETGEQVELSDIEFQNLEQKVWGHVESKAKDNDSYDMFEHIKKVGSEYELVSHTGKNLGKYPTKSGAEKREKQVNYFKHINETTGLPQFSNDAELDKSIVGMIQQDIDGYANGDEMLAHISRVLIDVGYDNDETMAIMQNVESHLRYLEFKDKHDAEICPHCNGSGEGQHEGETCNHCNGAGESCGDDEHYSNDTEEYTLDETELNNGYDDIKYMNSTDYFPNGADSPVVRKTGPGGARQGDNPEQKKMQVAETHKELVYRYRDYLKESKK